MATVNFFYRSIKDEAPLSFRLQFRHEKKDYLFEAKSKIITSKDFWKKRKIKSRDIDIENEKIELEKKTIHLAKYILDEFKKIEPTTASKQWLKRITENYYFIKENPNASSHNIQRAKKLPKTIVEYIEYYKTTKSNESQKRILNVFLNKIIRFEKYLSHTITIVMIDENLIEDFKEFSKVNLYSENTTARDIKRFKEIANHAQKKGLKVNPNVNDIKATKKDVPVIYLTTDEIQSIEGAEIKIENYDIARDWLLISCYTGQRISDFMRFTSNMIRDEKGKKFLDFKQVKTQKNMSIPLSSKVLKILAKYGNEFPPKQIEQKYNKYIKSVCKIANINEPTEGTIKQKVEDCESQRGVYGVYPKWKLISSHTGRRSFATNQFGKMPTSYIKYFTGHSTEKQLLAYIDKANKDMADNLHSYLD